jgi:hypothetical protein
MAKVLNGEQLHEDALKLTAAEMSHDLRNDLAWVYTAHPGREESQRLARIGLKRALHAEEELARLRETVGALEAENALLRGEVNR